MRRFFCCHNIKVFVKAIAHNFVDPRAVETVAEGLDQYCKDQGIAHISDIVGQLEA